MIASTLAWSHPHVWVDVAVSPQTNAQGQIIALEERWTFDPFYAQMLLESILDARDEALQRELWQHLQDDITTQLASEHYYTFPYAQFAEGKNARLLNEDGELVIEVTMPLHKPAHTLRYQIYEPEYFVEVLHSMDHPTTFANGCQLEIIPANPSAEQFGAAAALDRDQQGEPDMGRHFAETGVLQCPS